MADFCLPKEDAERFLAAVRDGTISPEKLVDMTSAERREFLGKFVGEENAKDVNALLESKMLLKNQQSGMATWARQVAGLTKNAQRDMLNKIQNLDRALNPNEEKNFLADLVAQKLGGEPSMEEAKNLSAMAAEAARLRNERDANSTPESWTAYGNAVRKMEMYADSLKPGGGGWGYWAAQILNIPRTALTSVLHFSAPFVQGRAMMTDPEWARAFGEQMRYFADGRNYENLQGYIRGHPDFPVARAAKLGLTDLTDKLNQREEALQSSLLQHASEWLKEKSGNRIPDVIGASSRAFTGFLNYLRFQSFTRLIAAARTAGEDVSLGSKAAADIADVVNNFTGRGNLGLDRYPNLAPLLNSVFFAPRKWLGMVQRLNPERYANPNISATAKMFGTRQMLGYVAAVTTVVGLLKMNGVQVGLDPTKSDFLQVTIGKHSFDVTEGETTLFRLMARIFSGKYTSKTGNVSQVGYGNAPSNASLVLGYLRNKLAPVPGALVDMLQGTDATGAPATTGREAQKLFTPITVQEFYDWAKAEPKDYWSLIPALLVPFGLHMQTETPKDYGFGGGKVEDELNRLNFGDYETFHQLGDPKADELVKEKMGPIVQQRVGAFIASKGYQKMSDAMKAAVLRGMLSGAERQAKGQAAAEAFKNHDPIFQKLKEQNSMNSRQRALRDEVMGQGANQ